MEMNLSLRLEIFFTEMCEVMLKSIRSKWHIVKYIAAYP